MDCRGQGASRIKWYVVLFLNQCVDKPIFIYRRFHQRLSDTFHQNALGTIGSPHSKLRTYALLKKEIGPEKYLTEIRNLKIRKTMTKLDSQITLL